MKRYVTSHVYKGKINEITFRLVYLHQSYFSDHEGSDTVPVPRGAENGNLNVRIREVCLSNTMSLSEFQARVVEEFSIGVEDALEFFKVFQTASLVMVTRRIDETNSSFMKG